MEKKDIGKFEEVLRKKRTELEGALRQRDGIRVQRVADLLEEVQLASERELAVRSRDLESNLLRQVRAALDRIEDGTYGVCLGCDQPIPPRRLEAVPWAAYCVRCQEQADRRASSGSSDDWSSEARATHAAFALAA